MKYRITNGLERMPIKTKRVYEKSDREDGKRFLVDRVWPRGVKKEDLKIEAWVKEAAPSKELRKWFAHDPVKWEEFMDRYFKELDANPESWKSIYEAAIEETVTLVYASKNQQHNNAVALKTYLDKKLKG